MNAPTPGDYAAMWEYTAAITFGAWWAWWTAPWTRK